MPYVNLILEKKIKNSRYDIDFFGEIIITYIYPRQTSSRCIRFLFLNSIVI